MSDSFPVICIFADGGGVVPFPCAPASIDAAPSSGFRPAISCRISPMGRIGRNSDSVRIIFGAAGAGAGADETGFGAYSGNAAPAVCGAGVGADSVRGSAGFGVRGGDVGGKGDERFSSVPSGTGPPGTEDGTTGALISSRRRGPSRCSSSGDGA